MTFPLIFALIGPDARRCGQKHAQSHWEWQREQCKRVGVPLELATGIPTPGDPYTMGFSPYCQRREDAARRKVGAR